MRIEYGMPKFIEDVLIANREHDNRVSSNSIEYDAILSRDGRQWMVNRREVDYIQDKQKQFFVTEKYPDEN